MKFLKKSILQFYPYILIFIAVVGSYFPTFRGEFILDDVPLIKNNSYIKEIHTLPSYFMQEDGIVDQRDAGIYHTGYYRPLISLTYSLDYQLWGMNAQGFRTTNLVLHILCCFILFHFLAFLIHDRQAAFWVALLFSLHPVNTEAVSNIINRNNIIVAVFVLSSLYFYFTGWEKASYFRIILSIFFFAGAIFSKEFGLMIMPIIFLYHRMLSQEKQRISQEMISYLPYIILTCFYFILRKDVTGSVLTSSGTHNIWTRLFFVPDLILKNIELIFFPGNLHFFTLTYPVSFFNWHAIFSILMILFLAYLLWLNRAKKLLLFSSLSFLFFLFPVLNVIPTSSVSVITMRWLYLPMIFLSIAMAWILKDVLLYRWRLIHPFLIVIILYCGAYTNVLNRHFWLNDNLLFEREVMSFNNAYFAGDFAENLINKKEYQRAEKYFQIAISHYPNRAQNYINYSALLIDIGEYDTALKQLEKSKSLIMPSHKRGQWYNNAGLALVKSGKEKEGLKYLHKAVLFAPHEEQFWANLGSAYGMIGDYSQSVKVLLEGLKLVPDSPNLSLILAKGYIHLKDYKRALIILETIDSDQKDIKESVHELIRKAKQNIESNI